MAADLGDIVFAAVLGVIANTVRNNPSARKGAKPLINNGASNGARTHDPLDHNQML
jgi:hypothetical protein